MKPENFNHGEGADVKTARPENAQNNNHVNTAKTKTKVDMAPNKTEGIGNEPHHSTGR